MTLYVYGDSFSASTETINALENVKHLTPLEKNWIDLVQEGLGQKEKVALGVHGANNEIIYAYLLQHKDQYKDGDVIIVQPTNAFRKWFFADRPSWTNYWQTNFKNEIGKIFTKEEVDAVEKYKKYLYNQKAYEVNYDMFLRALAHFAQNNQHLRILILPGFHELGGVTGVLQDISGGEFIDDKVLDKYYNYHGIDPRRNHMTNENHKILADKIINFFKTGEIVDLTKDFHKEFITKNNYKTQIESLSKTVDS